jgi:hypothetical protein
VVGREESVIPDGTGAVGGYLLVSYGLTGAWVDSRPRHLTILQTTSLLDDNHFVFRHLHSP